MNTKPLIAAVICIIFLFTLLYSTHSQEANLKLTSQYCSVEYASVRFMGDKTSIVWPDGTVDNVMNLFGKKNFDNGSEKYPKGSDYRMYWLTIAMNIMGKKGFEFAFMQDTDVVMKRSIIK